MQSLCAFASRDNRKMAIIFATSTRVISYLELYHSLCNEHLNQAKANKMNSNYTNFVYVNEIIYFLNRICFFVTNSCHFLTKYTRLNYKTAVKTELVMTYLTPIHCLTPPSSGKRWKDRNFASWTNSCFWDSPILSDSITSYFIHVDCTESIHVLKTTIRDQSIFKNVFTLLNVTPGFEDTIPTSLTQS